MTALTPDVQDFEVELWKKLQQFRNDTVGFVLYALPWGEEGTALENHTGPDGGQVKVLAAKRDGIYTYLYEIQ